MDPRDFLRGFFGMPPRPRIPDDSADEEWDDPGGTERHSGDRDGPEGEATHPGDRCPHGRDDGRDFHFHVFSNPLEMERFFDRQLDDMLRAFGFGGRPPLPGGETPPGRGPGWNAPFEGWGLLPPPGARPPAMDDQDEAESASAGSRDFMLGSGFGTEEAAKRREDSDLDQLPAERIGEMLKEQPDEATTPIATRPRPPQGLVPSPPQGMTPFSGGGQTRSFGFSQSTQVVRRPDGSVEETTTKRGSDGSEETRVCRTDRYGNTECSTVRLAADGSTVETKEDGGAPGGRDMMTNEKVTTKSIFDKFFGQR